MDVPTQHTLAVPGATLYYEIRGGGPLLLLITGGNGDAGVFDALAERLADRYTVVAYDRRGFARSPLAGPPEDRVVNDGADAAALLTHLADQPACVLGSSSGAIVALELLCKHPELVRTVVAHEPPLATLLPDSATWLEFFDGIYRTSRTEGNMAAMTAFTEEMGLRPPGQQHQEPPPESAPMIARIQQNLQFWMENELRQYVRYPPDLAALRQSADKLVLGVGRDSKGTFPALPNVALAEQLGHEIVEFVGNHIGYVTDADEFATQLDQLLAT